MTNRRPTGEATSQSPEWWARAVQWLASPRWNGLWIALLLLMGMLFALDLVRVWRITNHKDLDVLVVAARRLSAGNDIYQDAGPFQEALESGQFSMKDDTVVWPYAYAPTVAFLFRPVLGLPHNAIRTLWWIANVCALLLGSWLSARSLSRSSGAIMPAQAILILALLHRFEPAVVSLRLGQIEIIQFLLLAFSLYALSQCGGHRAWEGVGGMSLGLATALKFFPGALIVLLIWRRRWRPALWALGVAAVTILGSFALVGWESLANYTRYASMYGLGGAFAAFPYNQSLNGLMSRNLVENVFSPTLKGWHLPALANALTVSVSVVIVAVSAWLTWQRAGWPHAPSPGERTRFGLEYGLGIAALLMVSPHSQVYAYTWAIIPMVVLGTWLISSSAEPDVTARPLRARWWQWAGLAISYLLIGRPYMLFRPGLTRLVQSHYLFGAAALWATIGLTLHRWRTVALQPWPSRPFLATPGARVTRSDSASDIPSEGA